MKEAVFRAFGIHRYGGVRPFLRSFKESLREKLGRYDSLKIVDWNQVERIVFVCKGNICRSPYAEAKARTLGIPSISCGLEASPGSSADPMAQRRAMHVGVDLTGHKSRALSAMELLPGDLVVLFDPAHLPLLKPASFRLAGITILGIWTSPRIPLIFDPHGKSQECFEKCFAMIDMGLMEISSRLNITHKGHPSENSI